MPGTAPRRRQECLTRPALLFPCALAIYGIDITDLSSHRYGTFYSVSSPNLLSSEWLSQPLQSLPRVSQNRVVSNHCMSANLGYQAASTTRRRQREYASR